MLGTKLVHIYGCAEFCFVAYHDMFGFWTITYVSQEAQGWSSWNVRLAILFWSCFSSHSDWNIIFHMIFAFWAPVQTHSDDVVFYLGCFYRATSEQRIYNLGKRASCFFHHESHRDIFSIVCKKRLISCKANTSTVLFSPKISVLSGFIPSIAVAFHTYLLRCRALR